MRTLSFFLIFIDTVMLTDEMTLKYQNYRFKVN